MSKYVYNMMYARIFYNTISQKSIHMQIYENTRRTNLELVHLLQEML